MNTLFNCSLWGDEAFSAILAQRPFWSMIKIVARDTSPPLFYIISFAWFKIFGSSEIAIRSLSFLFYLATAYIIYRIGKKLFNVKTGILAAILTFLNPFLLPFAFEGRMYFCLLFFTALSFYFLISKNKWGFIISATAVLYSHHFAVFALMSQFIWQFIHQISAKSKFQLKKFITPYILIGIFYIPWLYPLYSQTQMVASGFWLGKPHTKDLVNIFFHFIKGKIVFPIQEKLVYLAGAILLLRRWSVKNLNNDFLLILWAVFPPLATFLISQTSLSIFYERYLLYCIPPIMLLLASKIRKVSWVPLIMLFAIYFISSYHIFTHPFKRPFRQFASWIKENTSSQTFLINYNGGAHHLWESKYYQLQAPLYVSGQELPFYVGTAQMTNQDIVKNLPPVQKLGAISSDKPALVKIRGYQEVSYHQTGSLYFIEFNKIPD